MAEGYCVKCKAKKEIADGIEEVMKNGRKAIKGKCPTCGTVMFKILGGKAVAPGAPPRRLPLPLSRIYVPTTRLRHRHAVFAAQVPHRRNLEPPDFPHRTGPGRRPDVRAGIGTAQQYSEAIVSANDPQDRKIQELIRDYILKNLSPDPKTGRRAGP